jgi:hypothetical protein
MRRIAGYTLTILFTTFALSAGTGKQDEAVERVRVTETTVITVHESRVPVPEDTRKRRTGEKFRRGSSAVPAGAVRAGGWLLNVSDAIPSARERSAMQPRR